MPNWWPAYACATGVDAVRQPVAHQQRHARRLSQRRGVDAQLGGQLLVEHQQLGRGTGAAVHGTDRLGT